MRRLGTPYDICMNPFETTDEQLAKACAGFWHNYFGSMQELHDRQGRSSVTPLKDRNLGTTDSKHVQAFEGFWRTQLAAALDASPSSVGPRKIQFRPHRSKAFDVCWPLEGEPRILISIKSMQNAYRNFTNRIEEAFGDSAVLRLYRSRAVFGFFFFMLDGTVPRGNAEQGKSGEGDKKSGKGKGVAPYLDFVEQGGDFFDLSHVDDYRKPPSGRPKKSRRQDVIKLAEKSLRDLAASEVSSDGSIHYDAIAFVPTRVRRLKPKPQSPDDWQFSFSNVDDRLDFHGFVGRLIDAARLRGFVL